MATKKYHKLTDSHISAVRDFAEGETFILWDSDVRGLRIRIGKHRCTWTYFAQHRRRGKRSTTCRRLGFWSPVPNEGMSVRAARKAALQLAGRAAGGHVEPGEKQALLFAKAFSDYCAYLLDKATKAGKEPRWHRNVVNLGKLYLLPKFETWSLAEISRAPEEVRDWHRDVSKRAGDVTGNKCAKLLRATYRFAGQLRRDLPPELPTSGVKLNPEEPREAGMTDKQHRAWYDAWSKIENRTRAAYHLLAIFSGQRPGELARLKVTDILPHERCFVIRKAKADNTIRVPLSIPIVRALRMAVDAHDGKSEWLFPARAGGHIRRIDSDKLPLWGNGLRHNFKTIAVTMKPPVEEILTEMLMGHAIKGVSRKYMATLIVAKSSALREAQRRISARIAALLRPTVKAPALSPDGPQDAEATLLPALR